LTDHPQLLDCLHKQGVPFASIAPRDHPENCIGVMLREREAAAAMVEHLVSLGHRRIAHILGDLEHGAGIWRVAGYRDGLARAGLKEDPAYMVQGRFSFESGVAAMRQLLALPLRPTAVFAGDDDMAIATQVWPPLTTIHQPVREMGRRATQELLLRVLNKGEARMVEVDYQMRIRASTARIA